MKKLNRKGFTLIELLAVIVILAVIMVIATTSVLGSMNNSRKKSLLNSAESAAAAFNTAYAELALTNADKILGLDTYGDGKLLNGNVVSLGTDAATYLDITATDYDLTKSVVYFNPTTSKFTVCMVAEEKGTLHVGAAVKNVKDDIDGKDLGTDQILTASEMWACSDGTHSWEN